jgi:hypothetical protein
MIEQWSERRVYDFAESAGTAGGAIQAVAGELRGAMRQIGFAYQIPGIRI